MHAGVEPEKGINAIKVAAEAIANMPLGRIDEETVANIGTIKGGEARNIVPGEVMMVGMARSHDQSKLDAQIAAMRRRSTRPLPERREGRLRSRGEVPHVQDPRGALPTARPRARSKAGHRGHPPQERRRHRRQRLQQRGHSVRRHVHGHGGRTRTTEHIAIEDMVTACKIIVALVTQEPEQEDER